MIVYDLLSGSCLSYISIFSAAWRRTFTPGLSTMEGFYFCWEGFFRGFSDSFRSLSWPWTVSYWIMISVC